ncbi:MAG: YlxR family protein, partial [Solobacterium sp.]|nr:YlxR family protein [Solobacterium sp.]
IVHTPEDTIEVDTTGKRNGHGAYLKKDAAAVAAARKNGALDRALKTKIPDEIWDRILQAVSQ